MTEVRHDTKAFRFVLEIEGQEAILTYSQKGESLDFYHTFVPESLRGRGLAEKVVKAGFDYAKEKGLKVIPSCPYVSGPFLKRYGEYRSLISSE